jgi:hypothetical protein
MHATCLPIAFVFWDPPSSLYTYRDISLHILANVKEAPDLTIGFPYIWTIRELQLPILTAHHCTDSGSKGFLSLTSTTPWRLTHYFIKFHILGSGGISPHILDLGIRWRLLVSFRPRSLYLRGKSPRYPLNRRLCGPQSLSGHGGELNPESSSP